MAFKRIKNSSDLVHPNCRCEIVGGEFITESDACDQCKEVKRNWSSVKSIDGPLPFCDHSNKKQHFSDDKKYRIVAPALIPMEIYRNDESGEYWVEFTKEEIEDIYVKLMSNKPDKIFNVEHNTEDKVDAFILESWLVGKDTKADRSYSEFGIDVPEGTLMIVSQFNDKERYTELVNNDQVGYSIEGFLGLSLSEIINKNKHEKMNENLMLPDGEHTIGEKIYVIKDGAVVEIKDVVKEELSVEEEAVIKDAAEDIADNTKKEELAEDVKEDEETPVVEDAAEDIADEVKKEEMMVDPVVDEEAILLIIQPKLDEIYQMIAEIKSAMEMDIEEEVVEEVKMSKQEAFKHNFKAITNFLSK